jgi:hypothetical protein
VSERAARAERLRAYFGLQLLLAERIAAARPMPLAEAVLEFTNLHRRFGLGRPERDGPAAEWAVYAERLASLESAGARLDWTIAVFERAAEDVPTDPQFPFGCFAYEPPNREGVVRIHFYNRDSDDGVGPLAAAKIERRRADLRALFTHLRATYPGARSLRGGSWLYNLEAYRRLFPPAYVASRAPMDGPRLTGASTWGQLLRHDESVNETTAAAFLANLDALDPAEPWAVFPHRAQVTSAPVEAFYGFYE